VAGTASDTELCGALQQRFHIDRAPEIPKRFYICSALFSSKGQSAGSIWSGVVRLNELLAVAKNLLQDDASLICAAHSISNAVSMATQAELDAWKALGGVVEEKKTGKRKSQIFVAPDGKYPRCCMGALLWHCCCSPAMKRFLRHVAALAAGKKLDSWNEAAKVMKAAAEQDKHGKCSSSDCGSSSGSSSSS
jgi:hypothetical protein